MLTRPPTVVEASGVIGAPVKYKWDNKRAMDLYEGVENVRLFNAINAANVRARMALATFVAEWIVWRFKGLADITDALLHSEAAWASVIDPAYAKNLDHTMSGDDDTEPIKGPLDLTLGVLGEAWEEYTGRAIWVGTHAMKLCYVARHVLPIRKDFDAWLTETLRRLAQTFPRSADEDEDAEEYDHSKETPVPRGFFEPSFQPSKAASEKAVREFLQSLEPKKNPYLRKGKAYSV